MPTEIVYTDEFNRWWDTLTEPERNALRSKVNRLAFFGDRLTSPHSKRIRVRGQQEMHELRAQSDGRPLRALYAFDPRRTAVVLLGGDKTGDPGFYHRNVPRAYDLLDAHIARLRREGLIQ